MIEFMLVEGPAIFPFTCVGCTEAKGTMLDTHREIPGYGHVYLCERCARTAAKLYGYASGARLDELSQASRAVGERDREIDSLRDQLTKAHASRSAVVRHDEGMARQLEQAHERIAQLEAVIRNQASQSLELVGDAAQS